MSDTPRTDKYLSFNPTETEEESHLAAFARELETDNAALLDALEEMLSEIGDSYMSCKDSVLEVIAKAKGDAPTE